MTILMNKFLYKKLLNTLAVPCPTWINDSQPNHELNSRYLHSNTEFLVLLFPKLSIRLYREAHLLTVLKV